MLNDDKNNKNFGENSRRMNDMDDDVRYYRHPPTEIHHHYYYEHDRTKLKKSMKPGVAGALLIVTAVMGLILSGMMFGGGFMLSELGNGSDVFDLGDTGDLTGRITYLNGEGVENATISIVGEGLSTTTDESGYYTIYSVPIGKQEIKVEKAGYNTYIKKMIVSPSEGHWTWDDNDGEIHNDNNLDFKMSSGDSVISRGSYPPMALISGFVYTIGIVVAVFSIIALIGGIFAIKRKNFRFAAAGAIFGIFTWFGAIFAIIALILLIVSKDEFKKKEIRL